MAPDAPFQEAAKKSYDARMRQQRYDKKILQGRHGETMLQWNRNARDPGRFETIWPL